MLSRPVNFQPLLVNPKMTLFDSLLREFCHSCVTAKEISARSHAPTRSRKSYCRSKSGGDNSRMRLIAALGALLIVSSLQAGDKDIIKDKSPDGKFALRMTKEEEGWSAAIINLKGKDAVVELEIYQNQSDMFIKQGHLVWSKDSQRVAYFEPDRRGGSTTAYFRNGSKFEQVELPDIPECKFPPANDEEDYGKTIQATTAPQEWLGSGALVLKVHSDELLEKGEDQRSHTCTQIVTVAFDANRKASVKSVKDKKPGHE